jgi:polysaccharide export outer membrane protein
MTSRFTVFLAALTLAASAASAQDAGPQKRGYEIGAGDKISGRVLGEAEFNFDSVVDDDGKIQVPFSDEGILAKCKTEKELRAEIATYLAKYLKNPQLSVNVVERNRPPAMIYGEINNPQKVVLTRPVTLLELISFSGGLRPDASGNIQVTRTMPLTCSEPQTDNWQPEDANGVSFPSRVFAFRTIRENNPTIYPGDIVDVGKASPVYMVGEVNRPGPLSIPDDGLPLTRALAMSAGTSREAKLKDIRVYRRKEGSPQPDIISVDGALIKKGQSGDFMLQPFDIVEVGKSGRNIGELLLDIATGSARNTANTLPLRVMY